MSNTTIAEKIIGTLGKFPIICPLCGHFSYIHDIDHKNLRETCQSHCCHSINRQRQIAYILSRKIGITSLNKIKKYRGAIYNTESFGNIHNQLVKNKHYISSEYFGNKHKSGETVNGFLHQDLMNLSFKNNSVDIVLSSDVFEHIPKPYLAHRQIFRILKKRGCHIFTVPFHPHRFSDETRAFINQNNRTVNLKPPIYHLDGIRPNKGALVYNIFGKEMISKLEKLGFKVKMHLLSKPFWGILGHNAIVFVAKKP